MVAQRESDKSPTLLKWDLKKEIGNAKILSVVFITVNDESQRNMYKLTKKRNMK